MGDANVKNLSRRALSIKLTGSSAQSIRDNLQPVIPKVHVIPIDKDRWGTESASLR